MPKVTLHDVLGEALCKTSATFSLQIVGFCTRWDYVLLDSCQPVYLSVPADPVTIPHVFVKKLQLCNRSVTEPINKTLSIISVACFTKISTADRTTLEKELELVNMDEALGQGVQHRNAIDRSLTKSYKITSLYDAVITMSSLLALLLNLADWNVADDEMGQEMPALCHFLEQFIKFLLSRAGGE